MSETYCYLLPRTDLPSLGHGKALAHAHHAGSHLTWTLAVEPLLAGGTIPAEVEAWHRSGGGFGVCAAIGSAGQIPLRTLQAVLKAAEALGQMSGEIVDTSYPMLVDDEINGLLDKSRLSGESKRVKSGWIVLRRETTCGWILGDKEKLEVILRRFDLVPND